MQPEQPVNAREMATTSVSGADFEGSPSAGESPAFVHTTAIVEDGAVLGAGTKVWHFCHVMSGARVGAGCVFGQGCFVAGGVVVGQRVRVQNHVSLFDGVELGDDVFVGPGAVFTNVANPRAAVRRMHQRRPTIVEAGATIGANATLICGVRVGRAAFVGAGAVVRRDVLPFELVVGVPARRRGWVSRLGHRLDFALEAPGASRLVARCGESGELYEQDEQGLVRLLESPGEPA